MQFDEDDSIRLREKTVTVDKYSSVEGGARYDGYGVEWVWQQRIGGR